MNLLRKLWSWYNSTATWEENESLVLSVDLDELRFMGVSPGDKLERLSFLGPGTVAVFGFDWPSKGINVTVEDDCVQEVGFFFGHSAEPAHGGFHGGIRYAGALVHLSKKTTEAEARSLFGEPSDHEQDEDETILYYEHRERLMQLEFSLDGTLKYLGIALRQQANAG